MRYKMGFLYIASGLIYLFFSGSAEGFASPRTPSLFLFLFAIAHGIAMVIAFLRKKTYPNTGFNFLGIFILTIGILAGLALDTKRTAETQKIGDQLIEKINLYSQKTGSYPSSLSDISSTLKPTLKNSEFYYHLDKETGFILGFPTFAFMQCERSPQSEWVCDD
jgi:hypothetical protein